MSTEESAQPDQSPQASRPTLDTTSPERLLMFGALLVLGVYVLFELIMGEYFQSWITLVAAAFILLLPRTNRSASEKLAPLPVLLKGLGYVVAIAGLLEALNALRFGQLDDALEIVGALIAYVGYVLSFLGARGIKA